MWDTRFASYWLICRVPVHCMTVIQVISGRYEEQQGRGAGDWDGATGRSRQRGYRKGYFQDRRQERSARRPAYIHHCPLSRHFFLFPVRFYKGFRHTSFINALLPGRNRSSPIGVISVCQMAAGDGLADIFGRRWGTAKWPFSDRKSYVGSLAFVVGAFTVCSAVLALFVGTGCLELDLVANLPALLLISIICALVELLPIGKQSHLSICVFACFVVAPFAIQ
jgi:hypothetical protein